jgi:hypothetical protein
MHQEEQLRPFPVSKAQSQVEMRVWRVKGRDSSMGSKLVVYGSVRYWPVNNTTVLH